MVYQETAYLKRLKSDEASTEKMDPTKVTISKNLIDLGGCIDTLEWSNELSKAGSVTHAAISKSHIQSVHSSQE